MKLLLVYLVGVVIIGLPMAKLSLWLYTMGEELDFSPHKKWLKLIRNFLHPGSFGFGTKPNQRNYQMNYDGPISEFVDTYSVHNQADRLKYLILSSLAWPGKIFFSLTCLALLGVLILIGLPFRGLEKVCEQVTKK